MKVKNPFKQTTKPDVPSEHKTLKKVWFWGKLIGVLIVVAFTVYGIWSFFDNYSLRSPFQNPIVPRHVNAIISPVGSPSGKLNYIFDVGKIADFIYMKESSSGRNDNCTNLGLYNGYGWHQNSSEWKCYSSRAEVRQQVIDWLTLHIKNGDIQSSLCLYNQGTITNSCRYSINYNNL